jgi:NADPH:quinone reductase
MKAVVYERRGAAREVLIMRDDLPMPMPGPNEVRVRIVSSGVNPSDVKSRRASKIARPFPWPYIVPHQDGSGVVDAVGDGVSKDRLGTRVWLFMCQIDSATGTAAQFVVTAAWKAVSLPDNASFAQGAMLGVPAMTAHYALFDSKPVSGKSVLVHGGAGGVGFYAVQLAKLAGASKVIATVSNELQYAEARRAGADHVILRNEDDTVEAIRSICGSANPIDRVVDVAFGVNQQTNLALLATGGVISAYGSDLEPEPKFPFWDYVGRDATVRALLIYLAPRARLETIAEQLSSYMQQSAFVHPKAIDFDFSEVIEAHEQVEAGGHVGKVVVSIGQTEESAQ